MQVLALGSEENLISDQCLNLEIIIQEQKTGIIRSQGKYMSAVFPDINQTLMQTNIIVRVAKSIAGVIDPMDRHCAHRIAPSDDVLDIILVGEIRDAESAHVVFEAALTVNP